MIQRYGSTMDQQCLNPCSNGIWSLTIAKMFYATVPRVLILVLMEYGLWLNTRGVLWLDSYRLNPCSNGIWSLTNVIEDIRRSYKSLNPCSNGIWSLTGCRQPEGTYAFCVLILVLMEYGLWPRSRPRESRSLGSRNPCSNGIWSLTRCCYGALTRRIRS